MTVVLGVDGGGTKTHAVLADETGRVLGAGSSGPSNWEMVGLRGAGDAIGDALDRALAESGVERGAIEAATFGLAGVDWPSDVPRVESALEALNMRMPQQVVNDSFIALRAGTREPWGAVVIAGTGTVAAGRNREGDSFRTLGLGRNLGDVGSASDVSEEAMRAVALAYVGRGRETSLSEQLCGLTGTETVAQMLEEWSRGGEQQMNAAPLVLSCAQAGDQVAQAIVEWAGNELGSAVGAVVRRLEMEDEPYELVLAGGLFRGKSELLEETISRCVPSAHLVRLRSEPVVGAVLMALDQVDGRGGPSARMALEEGVAARLRP